MQAYSNPDREDDPFELPDVEVFYYNANANANAKSKDRQLEDGSILAVSGWYWWTCLPGCLPDSEPSGPFKTEEDALDDAQSNASGSTSEGGER